MGMQHAAAHAEMNAGIHETVDRVILSEQSEESYGLTEKILRSAQDDMRGERLCHSEAAGRRVILRPQAEESCGTERILRFAQDDKQV